MAEGMRLRPIAAVFQFPKPFFAKGMNGNDGNMKIAASLPPSHGFGGQVAPRNDRIHGRRVEPSLHPSSFCLPHRASLQCPASGEMTRRRLSALRLFRRAAGYEGMKSLFHVRPTCSP